MDKKLQKLKIQKKEIQSNAFNIDTEWTIENVCINRVSLLNGLNVDEMSGFFPRDKENCP